jgi:putative OPT family oligopeptide transporter
MQSASAAEVQAKTRREPLAEFTLKAAITGIVLGVIFGAANAYLGLRVGMTVSASIPAAVMTVAIFAAIGRKATILEANLSQTIGSASTALATGSIFTLPALFLWGITPWYLYLQIVALCFLGGLLGLAAMIPLRRLLIVDSRDELPYPEGTACAEVLLATTKGVSGSGWIFAGIAVGAGVKLLVSLLFVLPDKLVMPLTFLPKAELAMELAPALIGVGFILGYRQAAVCVAGSLLSSLALIPLIAWIGSGLPGPLPPVTKTLIADMSSKAIWEEYIRYIGAGAVATAGLLTVLRGMPTMLGAFAAIARGMRKRAAAAGIIGGLPTDRDLPGVFVFTAIAVVVLVPALVPGIIGGDVGLMPRVVCCGGIALFGILFVSVAARIVGIVGVSSQPTSGITLVTLLGTAALFAAAGWTGIGAQAAVLTVGTVVAIAASKAGDISQDLKTGYLVGATPAKQQFGQLLGAAVACWAVAGTLMLLGKTYGFGSEEIPAPQAILMKTIIEGVLSGNLPWRLVFSGGGVALCGILSGANGLAFAIGVYLPLASMAPLYVGGCVRALAERLRQGKSATEADKGILAASGLVAGEGLAGVLVAGLVAAGFAPKERDPLFSGLSGQILIVLVTLFICVFLWRSNRTR